VSALNKEREVQISNKVY
jgi:carbonic anhydrase/acetyltransferase-like protein (isoleucine patch superfamily)